MLRTLRMNLLALNVTLFGELAILMFRIWLLFRSMIASAEFPPRRKRKNSAARFVFGMSC
jgi:hypothetical protein